MSESWRTSIEFVLKDRAVMEFDDVRDYSLYCEEFVRLRNGVEEIYINKDSIVSICIYEKPESFE